jgi:hypothetical protein
MAEIKMEHASIGDLKAHYFKLCPEPEAMSYDAGTVMDCAKALLELRRRAVDKQNCALLNEVKIMRDDLRDVIQTIRQNQNGQTTGILVPGMRDFHL